MSVAMQYFKAGQTRPISAASVDAGFRKSKGRVLADAPLPTGMGLALEAVLELHALGARRGQRVGDVEARLESVDLRRGDRRADVGARDARAGGSAVIAQGVEQ